MDTFLNQTDKGEQLRQPLWRVFDKEWYCLRYPDIYNWMQDEGYDDVEKFYHDIGCRYGHSPNRYFDEVWYRSTYTDVAKDVCERNWRSGFEHYCAVGYKSYSPHWLFNEIAYRRRAVSLTDHVLDQSGFSNGYDHYLEIGEKSGFSAGAFVDVSLLRKMAAHYPEYFHEGALFASWLVLPSWIANSHSISWYFDPVWYLEKYPHVVQSIERGEYSSALHHYLTNKTPFLFDPSAFFKEAEYRELSYDIIPALDAGQFRNGYDHFVNFGAHEGRSPCRGVTLSSYSKSALVRAQCESGLYDSIFTRYVAEKMGGGCQTRCDLSALSEEQTRLKFRKDSSLLMSVVARSPLDFWVKGTPEVSVIMVVHDQIDLTIQALSSLRANYPGMIELIIVDSGSCDETLLLSHLVEGAKVLRYQTNVGYLSGCNGALNEVTSSTVLLLNNDIRLYPNALSAALSSLYRYDDVGAVAGKLVRTNLSLQEAGSIIWRDGSTYGYRRQDDPNIPEVSFNREVDYGSAAFLLVKAGLLKRLNGYDTLYRPAYFEDTDLCVRLQKIGMRIVYDPLVMVEHLEFGSSGATGSHELIQKNWKVFAQRHQDFLRHQQPPHIRNALLGRERRWARRKRVLLIEDRIPLRGLGSGYVRSNDIIRTLVDLNYHVTVFPVFPEKEELFLLYRDVPSEVELALDQNLETLSSFLEERAGYYDLLWIGRTHNMARLLPFLNEASRYLPHCGAVLDTEVVAAPRTLLQRQLEGKKEEEGDLDRLLSEELRSAHYCQQIVAVTQKDADLIHRAGYPNTMVLGHRMEINPTPRSFEKRRDILFLGAFHSESSPNYDSMEWFIQEVLPLLDKLPSDVCLKIAGYVDSSVDMTRLGQYSRVDIIGAVENLDELFDQYRIFVAPTRFAGGLPFKIHEAAARGVPIVASTLLCEQVGWTHEKEILGASLDVPLSFASEVERLYLDEELWYNIRGNALSAVQRDADPVHFRNQVSSIVNVSLT